MNNIGVNGLVNTIAATTLTSSVEINAGNRSPRARLPTWSWSCAYPSKPVRADCRGQWSPVPTIAVSGVLSGVDKPAPQRRGEIVERAEILVVAGSFAGQQCMQRVVKVVAPLRIETVAAGIATHHDARIIEI